MCLMISQELQIMQEILDTNDLFFSTFLLYNSTDMDDLYRDSTFDENDDSYEHHDINLLTGKLRCFRKAKATCIVILDFLKTRRYRSLQLLLLVSKRSYRNLFRRFQNNRIIGESIGL